MLISEPSLMRRVVVTLLLLSSAEVRAQRVGWSTTIEASGTVLFGNSTERIAASRVQLGRADSIIEVRSDARVRYAEACWCSASGRRSEGARARVSLRFADPGPAR